MSILLKNLNPKQLEAVTHVNGPLLIVAGAGTGKTTVITRRIAYLLEQKLAEPNQILALTFTEKAATEMEERVDQLLPLGNYDLWISTFHSFCERVLKLHGLHIGLPNDYKLLDQTSQWIFIHQNFHKFELNYYRPIGNPNKFTDAMLKHFSKCKDELITPEDYLEYASNLKSSAGDTNLLTSTADADNLEIARITELANCYRTYQQLMLEHNYLDFADLISYTIQLLQKRPNIRKLFQEQFKFIMVDEFQDTNIAQYELVKLLTKSVLNKPTRTSPKHKTKQLADASNLVVVGDDDQSIYKFRGASVSNILKLKKDYPDIAELTLIDNYRSNQEILDLAYNFIQANNPNRLEPQLRINKRLKGHNKTKAVINVLEGKDLSEELNLVTDKISEIKAQHPDISWNEFAILIRANSSSSEIIPLLESRGIPFSYTSNRGLYKKPLIADIINYLKLLQNYHDSKSLFRVLNFPKFHLEPIELAHITQFTNRKTISLYESLDHPELQEILSDSSKSILRDLLTHLKEHSKLTAEKSAVELFVQIIADLGIDRILFADTLENAQNRELLDQFYKKIESYVQENEDRTMRGFLEYLRLEEEAGEEGIIKFDPNSGPESLKLMTIHNAKGLEFEYVFLINMVDQRFPSRSQKDPIEIPEPLIKDILPEGDFHLQEERRLFYVAITRAKTQLYLSWGADYGGTRAKKPSLFLTETGLVPSELVKKSTGKVIFSKPKSKAKASVYKVLPTKFSFSQVSTFLQCPLEYKYRYYLRLPLEGSHYFSFGSTIHSVLQKYLEDYQMQLEAPQEDLFGTRNLSKLPPYQILEDLLISQWQDDWYKSHEQKQQYKARGQTILKTFFEETTNHPPKPKLIEQPFTLKLGDKEQYQFNGKIDRADLGDDSSLVVIDYKTSEKVPTKTSSNDLDQLRIYQWAIEEFFGQKVEALKYWYLVPNQFVDIKPASTDDLEALKKKLTETIEQIREAVEFDLFAKLHKKSPRHDCSLLDLI